MTAPTIAVEWLLARAAVRQTGLLHVVSRRDSGALNPLCGANPIRSREIETHDHLTDVALLCDGCGTLATSFGGTVRDGVALLLGLSAATTTTRLLELPIEEITARRDHARQSPGDGLDALADSILERGVVTPLIVRRHGRRFQIVDGARRLYAAAVAGLTTVPAIVRDATDTDVLLDGLVANLHRADLNPVEQARAYQHALEQLQCTQSELARRLAVSQSQMSNTLRLLVLPTPVLNLIESGAVSATHARELLRMDNPADQAALAAEIAAHGLSVKDTAARRATAAAPGTRLVDVAELVAAHLAQRALVAKVGVQLRGDRAHVTFDVAGTDLEALLEQFGARAVLAA